MTEEEMNEIISKFIATQGPLGREFEKVLYDNLWELYEKEQVEKAKEGVRK